MISAKASVRQTRYAREHVRNARHTCGDLREQIVLAHYGIALRAAGHAVHLYKWYLFS